MGDPVKPSGRKVSLVSAAKASSSTAPSHSPAIPSRAIPGMPPSSMQRVESSHTVASNSSGSPTKPVESTPAAPSSSRPKFKPKVPIKKAKAEPSVEVKPEYSHTPTRGGFRGRGRGGRGGGNVRPSPQMIPAGVFGGARTASTFSSRSPTKAASVTRVFSAEEEVDEYSDDEEGNRAGVIDIALVSGLDESAPTSLYRDRRSEKKVDKKGKSKESNRPRQGGVEGHIPDEYVKDEPISPDKLDMPLPPTGWRPEVETMDIHDSLPRGIRREVDELGEVNEAQRVDLSESESEVEEEDMDGDFVYEEGMDDPNEKLYMFQFPQLFPRFVSRAPVDLTNEPDAAIDSKEGIKDVKPDIANSKKKNVRPPEGRIGTLVVMKSGKVKMVLGDDIVMNVTPGLPSTFIQNLTHLDSTHKSTTVLGEINKSYVVTPDVDKLLQELYLNGGMTPADKEAAERKRLIAAGVKLEPELVKMELD